MVKKITIDPRTLLAWTTSTNYRIAITDGLVREVGNNRSYSPAVPNQQTFTTFESGPYVSTSSFYVSTSTTASNVVFTYNRQLRTVDNPGNFYLTNTATGVLHTFTFDDPLVSFDGNKKITIDLSNLIIPEGSYYLNTDAGVFTDNFNFPNIAEIIIDFSTANPKIFYVTSISNMKDRNYFGKEPNKIFKTDVPQIIDVDPDPNKIYTLTLSSPIGNFYSTQTGVTTEGVSWISTDTKEAINQAFKNISFIPVVDDNPDSTFTYQLKKSDVELVTKTLILYGVPFTLGGEFILSTSNKQLHWYRNIPLSAVLTTSTIFDGSDDGLVTFKSLSINGISNTSSIFTTSFVNNVASTASISLPSTGTYIIRADWEGRVVTPRYYPKSSNEITIEASEREYYPGVFTLTSISHSSIPTIADIFYLQSSYSTSTTNSLVMNEILNDSVRYLTSVEFTSTTNSLRLDPSLFTTTASNHQLQIIWDGQAYAEGQNYYPFYGTSSNIITVADRANYPDGGLIITKIGDDYQMNTQQFVLTAIEQASNGYVELQEIQGTEYKTISSGTMVNGSYTFTIDPNKYAFISNTNSNHTVRIWWEGQPWILDTQYPYHPAYSSTLTQTITTASLSLTVPITPLRVTDSFNVIATANTSTTSGEVNFYAVKDVITYDSSLTTTSSGIVITTQHIFTNTHWVDIDKPVCGMRWYSGNGFGDNDPWNPIIPINTRAWIDGIDYGAISYNFGTVSEPIVSKINNWPYPYRPMNDSYDTHIWWLRVNNNASIDAGDSITLDVKVKIDYSGGDYRWWPHNGAYLMPEYIDGYIWSFYGDGTEMTLTNDRWYVVGKVNNGNDHYIIIRKYRAQGIPSFPRNWTCNNVALGGALGVYCFANSRYQPGDITITNVKRYNSGTSTDPYYDVIKNQNYYKNDVAEFISTGTIFVNSATIVVPEDIITSSNVSIYGKTHSIRAIWQNSNPIVSTSSSITVI